MFIGHYAAAIGLSSFIKNRKGVLTFISLASVIPDILMLSFQQIGSKLNFHADLGLIACIMIIFLHGKIIGADRKIIALGMIALIIHIVFDLPYMAQDNSNFYHFRTTDFILESGLLILASATYIYKHNLLKRKQHAFFLLIFLMLFFQASWNFVFY